MNKLWSDRAWDEYLYWQQQDKKIIRKIKILLKISKETVYLPE